MSYHNGSIWPHDNALIAYGLSCYGLKEDVLQVFSGLFDVSAAVNLHRMPELFCGFPRRSQQGPTEYPVACAPQSWSAAAVFLLLQSCLGLSIDAPRREVRLHRPKLPQWLREVTIRHLCVGEASVDLSLRRRAHGVGLTILQCRGDLLVVVT
jgi:glycogen debranching enzyme